VLSTPDDELGASITKDGRTLYFMKSAPPHYLYIFFESHLVHGRWGQPTVLPFSGRWKDTDPVLSPDEQTMLFASDRPVHGEDRHHFYIWRVRRTPAGGFGEPEFMEGPVNDGFNQVFCSVAANGDLYFVSSRKTGLYDVFCSRLVDGRYQPAEDLGPAVNGPGISTFEAFIAPDESYLLLGSFGRKDSRGSSDLYVSWHRDGQWTAPVNLGPGINTTARDYSPRISGDGKWLLFTSERFDHPLTLSPDYAAFTKLSRGLYNGLGNLYRVPLEQALRGAQAPATP
jgi:Tol biopolymer transport system component